MNREHLIAFVQESFAIEGIKEVSDDAINAHIDFINLDHVGVPELVAFVKRLDPSVELRNKLTGNTVKVGGHVAPKDGPWVEEALRELLGEPRGDIMRWHHRYLHLHPFTDCNGRSGRALWAWQSRKSGWLDHALRVGFLRWWYYETLAMMDGR